MFRPEEIVDEKYEKELQEDIEFECAKLGTVNKITLFTKHPEGVVIIKFASSGSAATCIDVMNGRFFAGRKLTCNYWDGTNYTYRESKEEEQKRAEEFNQWLEGFSSSSDEESEEEEEKDDENIPSAEEVHTGRVMPALED
jgi:HIV Tat-specific factor 1